MDPNANLTEATQLAGLMLKQYDDESGNGIDQDDAARLAELLIALDGWIRNGGALPSAWKLR